MVLSCSSFTFELLSSSEFDLSFLAVGTGVFERLVNYQPLPFSCLRRRDGNSNG